MKTSKLILVLCAVVVATGCMTKKTMTPKAGRRGLP